MSASDYVCPQCGPDANGGEVHALTHHRMPPCDVEDAKELAFLRRELTAANEKLATMQRECFSSVCRDLRYQLDQATARADLWRARCKEAQRCLDNGVPISVTGEAWVSARDAGKYE